MDSNAFLANVSKQERGDRALVKDHLRRYVPYFQGKANVVDLGCGSGEFLELLHEAKINALGGEDSPTLLPESKALGLNVKKVPIPSFLKSCKANSVRGFFISHVVEHLPPKDMME